MSVEQLKAGVIAQLDELPEDLLQEVNEYLQELREQVDDEDKTPATAEELEEVWAQLVEADKLHDISAPTKIPEGWVPSQIEGNIDDWFVPLKEGESDEPIMYEGDLDEGYAALAEEEANNPELRRETEEWIEGTGNLE